MTITKTSFPVNLEQALNPPGLFASDQTNTSAEVVHEVLTTPWPDKSSNFIVRGSVEGKK